MADITKALRTRLLAVSGVTDLVGTRIYPQWTPQNATLPAVVYQFIYGDNVGHMGAPSGLASARIEYACFADLQTTAFTVAEAIRTALDGWNGTVDSVEVHEIRLDSRYDEVEAPGAATDQATYVHIIDFSVWYAETVPTF